MPCRVDTHGLAPGRGGEAEVSVLDQISCPTERALLVAEYESDSWQEVSSTQGALDVST